MITTITERCSPLTPTNFIDSNQSFCHDLTVSGIDICCEERGGTYTTQSTSRSERFSDALLKQMMRDSEISYLISTWRQPAKSKSKLNNKSKRPKWLNHKINSKRGR